MINYAKIKSEMQENKKLGVQIIYLCDIILKELRTRVLY